MADEYTIRTVADFAKIPEDKLQECLADFVQFLALIRHPAEINKEMQMIFELPDGSLNFDIDVFCWIDDGIRRSLVLDFLSSETGERIGRMDWRM